MQEAYIRIDRERSAQRIERDVETLGGSDYTTRDDAICRYAYTPEFARTEEYFMDALRELGYEVFKDPVGNLVARNRPRGERVFGVGSHCDSNRNGGKYDGTLGVVTAIAGITWYDVLIAGRVDHAGATPMDFRLDASVPDALTVVELERLARAVGSGAVGTAGAFEVDPGLVNVIPGHVRVGMDIREPSDETVEEIVRGLEAFVEELAGDRGSRPAFAASCRCRPRRWTNGSSRRSRARPSSRASPT